MYTAIKVAGGPYPPVALYPPESHYDQAVANETEWLERGRTGRDGNGEVPTWADWSRTRRTGHDAGGLVMTWADGSDYDWIVAKGLDGRIATRKNGMQLERSNRDEVVWDLTCRVSIATGLGEWNTGRSWM